MPGSQESKVKPSVAHESANVHRSGSTAQSSLKKRAIADKDDIKGIGAWSKSAGGPAGPSIQRPSDRTVSIEIKVNKNLFDFTREGLSELLTEYPFGKKHADDRKNLCFAVFEGDIDYMVKILRMKVDVNEKHPTLGSALASAVSRAYIAQQDGRESKFEFILKILVAHGADPNLQIDFLGCGSALALAAFRGMARCVDVLCDIGADVNLKLERGRYGNALTAACCSDSIDSFDRWTIFNILITRNANVNDQLLSGDFGSALSAACEMDRISDIYVLLGHGANPRLPLKQGSFGNAILVAIAHENPQMIYTLWEAGAALNRLSKHLLTLKISESPLFRQAVMEDDRHEKLLDSVEADPEKILRRSYDFSGLPVLSLLPGEIRTKLFDITVFTKDIDTVKLCKLSRIIGWWNASAGLSVLEALEKALKSQLKSYLDEHLCIQISGQHVNFMCDHSEPWLKDTFDWIYYAISNSAYNTREPDKIKVLLSPEAMNINLINHENDRWIDFPVSNSPGSNGYCWTSLFEAEFVICMPLRLRSDSQTLSTVTSQGLLLDFPTMAQLAAVEYPVPVNEGLVFLGYSTALVPIKETNHGRIIWHVEIGNEDSQLTTSELVSTKFEWMQTRDLTYLQSRMALLGWCTSARVLLGSDKLKPSVSWSITKQKPNTWHWKGANVQTVMQSSAPLQIGGQIGGSFDRVSNMVRFRQSTNYIRCLEGSSRQSIVLYDVSAKRAWLVPLLSVFHHMLFVYCHYVGEDATEEIPPPVEATPDGTRGSLVTLRDKGGIVIQKAGEDSLTVRELIMKFSSNMSQVSLHKPRGSEIFGYEFMDIVTEPTTATLKKTRIEKEGLAWISILNEVNCLFCSNLGEAIVGSRAVELSSPCNSLPTGSDFLAASMQCVRNLSERYGGCEKDQYHRLSNAHFWKFSVTALEPCRHNNQDAVNCWENPEFLQRIRNSRPSPEQDSECLSGYRNAAVVFGSPIKAESNRGTGILKNMSRLSIDPAQEKVSGQRAKIRNSFVRSG